jgi:competence protein ComEC
VVGVFYIFLLLQYTKTSNKWVITLMYIPIGIFVLMLPVVHALFPVTSSYQLLSPLLSLLFILFYPLSMVLHIFGLGGLFDAQLMYLFHLPLRETEHLLPLWAVFGYIVLSVGAIWEKKLFYTILTLAIGYGFYVFVM